MTKTVLYVINSENYFQKIVEILRKDVKDKTVVYVTTNKPYKNLLDLLKGKKLRHKFFFVDCISKSILGKESIDEKAGDCVYVESPQSLTSISIAINETMKHISGTKTLFLDSLSTLLIYNDAVTIGRFSNFLINKLSMYDVNIIVLSLESDIDKDIIRKIQSFVDEVKHAEKRK